MTRIEALAMGIAREHHAFESFSDACRTLNPGMLRSHSNMRIERVNGDGLRVFNNYESGHRALVANIKMKCEGKTSARNICREKIGPSSSLTDLCRSFGGAVSTRNIVDFLQDVLDDRAVNERTPISFFMESN